MEVERMKMWRLKKRDHGKPYPKGARRMGVSENGEGYVYRSSERSCRTPSEPFLNLPYFIFSQGHQHSKAALIDAPSGRRVSYGELQRHVELAASALTAQGVHHGDVVGLVAPNSIEYGVLALAIMSMGSVVCPCNPSNTAAELKRQLLLQAEAKLVITRHDLVDKLKQLELPLLLIQEGGGDIVHSLDDIAVHSGDSFSASRIPRQEDTAVLLFSSGTTGLSKSVVLSHANLIAATLQYEQEAAADDVFLLTTPLFHAMGFVMCLCRELKRGLSILILEPRFQLHKMLDAVQRYRVTEMAIVPTIFQMLVKSSSAVDQYDLSSLRNFRTGGAPLGRVTMLALKARLPHVDLRQGYGLTETSGIGTRSPLEDDVEHYGSAGVLAACMEAKVVDADTGKSLPPNGRGELWLRGPCIMQGYLKNPEATTSTVDAQGWFHTGDVVYFEEDGHMHVVDRIKELIKYKSFQVAPAELEEMLLSHPMIQDAAVIPFPDELAGQIPAAFVVTSPGATLSASAVEEFVAQQVAPFKRIRRVTFVNSIPKLPSGKILRRELIKLLPSSRL